MKRKGNFAPYNLVIFDSFENSNYLDISKDKIDLAYFSSGLVNTELLALSPYFTIKSGSIFIFMQIAIKEEVCVLLLILNLYY